MTNELYQILLLVICLAAFTILAYENDPFKKHGRINQCLRTKTTPCLHLVRPGIVALHT